MGTAGYIGFYYKGKFYLIYIYYEYIDGVGLNIIREVIKALNSGRILAWKRLLANIKLFDDDSIPTSSDEDLLSYIEKKFSIDKLQFYNRSWSEHFKNCLDKIKDITLETIFDIGFNIDSNNGPDKFINEEEYANEYTYVVNFDTETFDFYLGDTKIMETRLSFYLHNNQI